MVELKESLKAHEYERGVSPKAFVMFGSPPARFSILSSSTLPNLPRPRTSKPSHHFPPPPKTSRESSRMGDEVTEYACGQLTRRERFLGGWGVNGFLHTPNSRARHTKRETKSDMVKASSISAASVRKILAVLSPSVRGRLTITSNFILYGKYVVCKRVSVCTAPVRFKPQRSRDHVA